MPRTGQAHGSITTTVLFDREIVSLLERRCVSCHNEGGLSFPLSTYEQTWVKRLSMRTEVLRRHMPPWAAVPGYGEFANDNGLTPRETQFLVSWVEGLGPRNAGSTFLNVPAGGQAPAPVRASAPRRRLAAGRAGSGPRALESITVPPSPRPVVQRATIDLGLTEPQRIGAIEFLPGDRRRLRAAWFRVESTGQWLGSWTPWYGFAKLPQGVAFQLPAGARLSVELHYGAGAEPVTDVGRVGLFLARGASAPPSRSRRDGARHAWPIARAPRLGTSGCPTRRSGRSPRRFRPARNPWSCRRGVPTARPKSCCSSSGRPPTGRRPTCSSRRFDWRAGPSFASRSRRTPPRLRRHVWSSAVMLLRRRGSIWRSEDEDDRICEAHQPVHARASTRSWCST